MDKMPDPPRESNALWTYTQVAAFLHVSLSTAKRLPIPRVKIDHSVRFFPERVRDWAASRSIPRLPEDPNV